MTKPKEARQSWPEIGTIEYKQSFVEGGEVWVAVRLPQNLKTSLVIQRVALEGITQTKVNSLNEKTSRISVRLLSSFSLPVFFQVVLTEELRQLPINKFGNQKPWDAQRIGDYEQLHDVQHCQDTLYINIPAVATVKTYLLAFQKDHPVPIRNIRVFGEFEGENKGSFIYRIIHFWGSW